MRKSSDYCGNECKSTRVRKGSFRPILQSVLLSPALPSRESLQHANTPRFKMFEVRSIHDWSRQCCHFVAERIAETSRKLGDDSIPVTQRTQKPIHIAVFCIPRIVAHSYVDAGGLDLVEQFN